MSNYINMCQLGTHFFFFYFPSFFATTKKILIILVFFRARNGGGGAEKRKFTTARLTTVFATRWTGNKHFFTTRGSVYTYRELLVIRTDKGVYDMREH